jgi:hypothetical protein
MAKITIEQAAEILDLVSKAEPVVVNFIHGILQDAQGKTGDQFLADAENTWSVVEAKAKAELGQS